MNESMNQSVNDNNNNTKRWCLPLRKEKYNINKMLIIFCAKIYSIFLMENNIKGYKLTALNWNLQKFHPIKYWKSLLDNFPQFSRNKLFPTDC